MTSDNEEITTADGRSVILKPDRTYEFKGFGEERLAKRGSDFLLYMLVVVLGVLCSIWSYCLEHQYGDNFLIHLLKEIGFALLVAVVLARTVEHVQKKRDEQRFKAEREAIKKDVFEHVLGYRLPKGTFEQLDNQILGAKFIRRNFRCSYVLQELKGTVEKFMEVKATFTYEIVNRTPEKQSFLFLTVIENAPVESLNENVKFTSVRVTGCEPPIDLDTDKKLSDAVKRNIRPNHKVIQEPISIPAFGSASAVVNFDSVKAFEGGVSFLLHKLQTVGFYLRVEVPPDVEVSADAYFPGELREGSEHHPGNNTFNWVFDHPILPYQGVYVTWKSKPRANSLTSQPTTPAETAGNVPRPRGNNPTST